MLLTLPFRSPSISQKFRIAVAPVAQPMMPLASRANWPALSFVKGGSLHEVGDRPVNHFYPSLSYDVSWRAKDQGGICRGLWRAQAFLAHDEHQPLAATFLPAKRGHGPTASPAFPWYSTQLSH